jgi:hypothetical protein
VYLPGLGSPSSVVVRCLNDCLCRASRSLPGINLSGRGDLLAALLSHEKVNDEGGAFSYNPALKGIHNSKDLMKLLRERVDGIPRTGGCGSTSWVQFHMGEVPHGCSSTSWVQFHMGAVPHHGCSSTFL